ncbi:hypothetical protein AB0I10_08670 [Streptomyces sp. NPDC050636]|uniref:hypothetical protein n=1 Tax=Streptomyces sp. NPDC050636 TaxID=3154510 RepID=UPI003419479F
MADDPYNWLDKDAAERMLRGDPAGPRDGVGARELEQLLEAAKAVGGGAPGTTELPGEEAAIAAFRRAHHGTGAWPRNRATGDRVSAVSTTRSGGIAERARLGRPFRRGFAVALTVCAIGGVAVAAGTGMLPPFEGDGPEPEPGSSVSAAETPGTFESKQPDGGSAGVTPQSPDATPGQGTTGPTTPGGGHSGSQRPGDGTQGGDPGHENTVAGGSGDDGKSRPDDGDRKKLLLALCHNYQSGKQDSMDRDMLRRLEHAAGGRDKVRAFCRKYLASNENGGGSGGDDGYGGGSGGSGHGGSGGNGNGNGNGQGGGDGDDDADPAVSLSPSPGASTPAPAPTATPSTPGSTTPSPAPTGQV